MSQDMEASAAASAAALDDTPSSSEKFVVRDPSTRSNYRQVAVKHYHWLVEVDFPARVLRCSARLKGTVLKDGCTQLILDVCDLRITSVTDTASGDSLEYEISSPEGTFGSILTISSPSAMSTRVGTEFSVTVSYETVPSCSAVQWLRRDQTAGKKHPYLYTQCQPIHARSMLPCMDTPSNKATYTAEVTVPSDLTALMSAEGKGSEANPTHPGKKVFKFEQKVPIPSYLMALVVGALESRQIGPRSKVWCEKEMIEQAEWEFSETDKILCTAEELAGPYVWGVYDVLVLPPSFPYGGMENPCLTFISPTVLSTDKTGDKSAASRIVAHEVSHSWTGNLVTNVSWEHFWLNEGWTTYLERKIIARLYGEKERQLLYIGGWKALVDAVEHFKSVGQLSLTAMVPHLSGVHPDDAFSTIPYEKGSLFLFYLESMLGGPGSLDGFIKQYLFSHKFATIDTESWNKYFLGYFAKEAKDGLFSKVDWVQWFYGTGMPPHTPEYDTTLADVSIALAGRWAKIKEPNPSTLAQFSTLDVEMSSQCLREFLNQLLLKAPLPVALVADMDSVYRMSKKQDAEVKFRWQMLCLKSGYTNIFPQVVDFITRQGRMKYIRPLYRSLFACGDQGKALALKTFASFRSFYHGMAASQLEKDLQLKTV